MGSSVSLRGFHISAARIHRQRREGSIAISPFADQRLACEVGGQSHEFRNVVHQTRNVICGVGAIPIHFNRIGRIKFDFSIHSRPMLVKKTDRLRRKGNNVVGGERAVLRVIVIIQHHRQRFESALVMIPYILITGVCRIGVASPVSQLVQTKKIERFREERAAVPVILARRRHLQGQHVGKTVEPWLHQIEIARSQQRPV